VAPVRGVDWTRACRRVGSGRCVASNASVHKVVRRSQFALTSFDICVFDGSSRRDSCVSSSPTISRWSLSSYPFASAKSRDQRDVRQVGRVRGGRQLCHDARRSPGGKSARRGRPRRSGCIRRPKLYLQQGTIIFHLFALTLSRFTVLSSIVDTTNSFAFFV
jgi:hypothetical protein